MVSGLKATLLCDSSKHPSLERGRKHQFLVTMSRVTPGQSVPIPFVLIVTILTQNALACYEMGWIVT